MKLTTKGRYAVTAMLDIAIRSEHNALSLADISRHLNISQSYLEQLFNKLKRYGLVRSQRGAHGGYQLDKPSHTITIGQIVEAVSESVDITNCRGKGNCNNGSMCITHHLWEGLSQQIQTFMNTITLASLIEQRNQQPDNGFDQPLKLLHSI